MSTGYAGTSDGGHIWNRIDGPAGGPAVVLICGLLADKSISDGIIESVAGLRIVRPHSREIGHPVDGLVDARRC